MEVTAQCIAESYTFSNALTKRVIYIDTYLILPMTKKVIYIDTYFVIDWELFD